MKPCISQATTLKNPFEADPDLFSRNGWTAVEIWLTKLESFLEGHSPAEARACSSPTASNRSRRRRREVCFFPEAPSEQTHWDHFRRRLALLGELEVPTLIVTPDFVHQVSGRRLPPSRRRARRSRRAGRDLRRADRPRVSKVVSGLCLPRDGDGPDRAGRAHAGAGVCLDVFHYYTGPSKFEDLAYLSPRNLAWVQVCDLSGTPRELAGDGDRILPGEGDFQLGPIVEHLGRIGYDGYVSLEVLNPHLWQVDSDRVADLGRQALSRVLGRWESAPRPFKEGPRRVVGGEPPTPSGRVPRRAILRLAGLRPDRTGGSSFTGLGLGPRARLVARIRTGPRHRPGAS